MRLSLVAIVVFCGCNFSTLPQVVDLEPDIHVTEDLAGLPDLLLVDLRTGSPTCTLMDPGFYIEATIGHWSSSLGGGPTPFMSSVQVIVQNDGRIVKAPISTWAPASFYCDAPTSIDPAMCTAPCCAGPTSPILYFGKRGWRLLRNGTCQVVDATNPHLIYYFNIMQSFANPQG